MNNYKQEYTVMQLTINKFIIAILVLVIITNNAI